MEIARTGVFGLSQKKNKEKRKCGFKSESQLPPPTSGLLRMGQSITSPGPPLPHYTRIAPSLSVTHTHTHTHTSIASFCSETAVETKPTRNGPNPPKPLPGIQQQTISIQRKIQKTDPPPNHKQNHSKPNSIFSVQHKRTKTRSIPTCRTGVPLITGTACPIPPPLCCRRRENGGVRRGEGQSAWCVTTACVCVCTHAPAHIHTRTQPHPPPPAHASTFCLAHPFTPPHARPPRRSGHTCLSVHR